MNLLSVKPLLSRIFSMLVLLISMNGCATGTQWVFHSFSFNVEDDPGVAVLDWRYGEENQEYKAMHQSHMEALRSYVAQGVPFYRDGAGGVMPIGDYIYVKWRIEATGEVLEDTVSLKGKLPKNMEFYTLHFVIRQRQLYVYLIPPTPPHSPPFNTPGPSPSSWPGLNYRKSLQGYDAEIKYFKDHQIYPEVK